MSEFRKAIGSTDPRPQAVEKFFMSYYILELERAEEDLKIARIRRDIANEKLRRPRG